MKRFYTFFLLTLVILITGCGQKSTEKTENSTASDTKESDKKIVNYADLDVSALEVYSYDGDGKAAYELANRYDYGNGVDQNYNEALKWYTKASELGIKKSNVEIGYLYLFGLGTSKDVTKAQSFFQTSIDDGITEGYVGMGRSYLYNPDLADASLNCYYNFRTAADAKLPLGTYFLGYIYEKGIGVQANAKLASEKYESLTDKNFADYSGEDLYPYENAAIRLGILYFNGTGVEQDKGKSLSLFEKAAKSGSAEGQYYAGVSYLNGYGTDKDYKKAINFFSEAEKYAPALNQLGYIYFNGLGIDSDIKQAEYYLKLAALQGYAPAQINLGYIYENGYDGEVNLQLAKSYYDMAAQSGYQGAEEAASGVEQLIDGQN
jgi:TPR repeat protein